MGIYIVLLLLPFALNLLFFSISDKNLQKRFIVYIYFIFLFCIYILRDFSVGSDIFGYYEIYNAASYHNWFDNSWIYMEPGYVFLMKLFNTLGFSFRFFMAILYLIFIIPLAHFILKFSKDVVLSLIIFTCFTFFVFSMSGLRQTVALGICLIAFDLAQKNGLRNFLIYCICILIAFSIHKSAFIFIPAYFIMRTPINWKIIFIYLIISLLVIFSPIRLIEILQANEITSYGYEESNSIGASFYAIVAIIIMGIILSRKSKSINILSLKKNIFAESEVITLGLSNYVNLLICAACIMLVFSGTILLRASMYYQIVILIILPNLLSYLDISLRTIFHIILIVILLLLFYYGVLLPNQFNIVPYKFSHDLSFFIK